MPACVNVWIFLESKKNQAGTFVTVCLLCMPGLEPVYRKSELCWGLCTHQPMAECLREYQLASGGFTGHQILYLIFHSMAIQIHKHKKYRNCLLE